MRGNVFQIEFRVLSGEFESIETSPRFARFLEENLVSLYKIGDRFHDASKNTVKWQKSRSEHCDFTKKIVASIFDKKNDSKQKVNEISQNWQCEMS